MCAIDGESHRNGMPSVMKSMDQEPTDGPLWWPSDSNACCWPRSQMKNQTKRGRNFEIHSRFGNCGNRRWKMKIFLEMILPINYFLALDRIYLRLTSSQTTIASQTRRLKAIWKFYLTFSLDAPRFLVNVGWFSCFVLVCALFHFPKEKYIVFLF